MKKSKTRLWLGGQNHLDDEQEVELARGLKDFLRGVHLQRLFPSLKRLGISNLEKLEEEVAKDLARLRNDLIDHDDVGGDLTEEEFAQLTKAQIEDYRRRVTEDLRRHVLHKPTAAGQRSQHLLFLSHYKVEAGTEAALMRSEIEQAISEDKDPSNLGKTFDVPAFLDSEDLQDLDALQERVRNSHNVALLLTTGVLTRPWCLVEIYTAFKFGVPFIPVKVIKPGVPIIPVKVVKPGLNFGFPDEAFYECLTSGKLLGPDEMQVLSSCGVTVEELSQAIRSVFKRIAVQYSPHNSSIIRKAEVEKLLLRCTLNKESERKG